MCRQRLGRGRRIMEIEYLDSYEDVRESWRALNDTYRGGELALDWTIHERLWENFWKPKGALLRILRASDGGGCFALLPFVGLSSGDGIQWIFGEESIIAREYFCPPNRIHELIPYCPQHACSDLSCFYTPSDRSGFVGRPGCIVDVKDSQEAYLASLGHKKRHDYLTNLKRNDDLRTAVGATIDDAEIRELKREYVRYWYGKKLAVSREEAEESTEKIEKDFWILRRAAEMGRLNAVSCYLRDRLVAVNFSVFRGSDRVDDYLCLRDNSPECARRGLGIYAILKNLEVCRARGVRWYDLSDFRSPYKNGFINTESFEYWCPVQDSCEALHTFNSSGAFSGQ